MADYISAPKLGFLTQGTLFTCAAAEDYGGCNVHGLVITARCDVAQNKAAVFNYLPVVSLDDWVPPQQGFERWLTLVTDSQKHFINQPLTAPHRIEGPAGTGKTLSLILKCLAELRHAVAKNDEHRSIFVAHRPTQYPRLASTPAARRLRQHIHR